MSISEDLLQAEIEIHKIIVKIQKEKNKTTKLKLENELIEKKKELNYDHLIEMYFE